MKKIFFTLVFLSFSVSAFAEHAPTFCPDGDCGLSQGLEKTKEVIKGSNSGLSTSDNLDEVILGYVDFFLPFLGIFAFVALVYAGFLYVTSGGESDQAENAKNIVKYVAFGIILVFLSYSIVGFLMNVI